MEQSCALCEKRAMMLCDSDQAKLCWDCDEKVHAANFLVAKHSRVLLCRLCHSPTPWKASGTKLTPTVSFCHRCVADQRHNCHQHQDYMDDNDDYDGGFSSVYVYDDDNDNDDSDNNNDDSGRKEQDFEEDEERENQVVLPTTSTSASSPPCRSGLALKRLRNDSFSVDSHEETACSSSEMLGEELPSGDESTSTSVFWQLKKHRIDQRNY
ncbi:hypothetical protein RJT34_30286 [Clitoria ternatea]|uniref:B box-type domain-containing protein n=1 Tax=Clitoria ternatea TaxID=43366 RepID=A0AAN9ES32_CLITE